VTGVVFQHVRSTSSLLGLRKKLVLPINRDLLVAACENFESRETEANNYSDTSLIYIPQELNGGVLRYSINPCLRDCAGHWTWASNIRLILNRYLNLTSNRAMCLASALPMCEVVLMWIGILR
jgi:hypothetical protein